MYRSSFARLVVQHFVKNDSISFETRPPHTLNQVKHSFRFCTDSCFERGLCTQSSNATVKTNSDFQMAAPTNPSGRVLTTFDVWQCLQAGLWRPGLTVWRYVATGAVGFPVWELAAPKSESKPKPKPDFWPDTRDRTLWSKPKHKHVWAKQCQWLWPRRNCFCAPKHWLVIWLECEFQCEC